MYKLFYSFKENPFNITPDPYFFYMSDTHRDILSNLEYGIHHRKGMMVVTGEVGAGKSTLCRKLISQLTACNKLAFITNYGFTDVELLQLILSDLGIFSFKKSKYHLIDKLNHFLIKQTHANRNVILLIDEAQNLTADQLEQIRLLSNLETDKEKLLQIILVGQPELDEKLHLKELRQVRQRISIYLNLKSLSFFDIKKYVQHRLMAARTIGKKFKPTVNFTEDACAAIYRYTEGIPRKINILCERALLCGFVTETYLIDEHIIEHAAKEVLYSEYHL